MRRGGVGRGRRTREQKLLKWSSYTRLFANIQHGALVKRLEGSGWCKYLRGGKGRVGERGGVSILKCVCMQLTHTCKRQLANMYVCRN